MKHLAIALAALCLTGCEMDVTDADPDAPPPPYPPGYVPAGTRIPEVVQAALPADVVPAQVLIADDGCYFYHRGATTFPVIGGTPPSRYCARQEETGQIIDLGPPG